MWLGGPRGPVAGPADRRLVVVRLLLLLVLWVLVWRLLLLRRCVGLRGRSLGGRLVLLVLLVLLGLVVWVGCCWGLAMHGGRTWAGGTRGGVVARSRLVVD